jgi:hypothetical protein
MKLLMEGKAQLERWQNLFSIHDEEMLGLVASGCQSVEEIRAITGGLTQGEESSHALHLAYKQDLIRKLFPHRPHLKIEYTPVEQCAAHPHLRWISEEEERKAGKSGYAWTMQRPTDDTGEFNETCAAYSLRSLLFHIKEER